MRLIQRLLSAMSWVEGQGATIEEWWFGRVPQRFPGKAYHTVWDGMNFFYLPQWLSPEARLALAFFREGLSLRSTAYQFLSFYKIINLKFDGGDNQKAWIKRTLPQIASSSRSQAAIDRVRSIQTMSPPIAMEDCLYGSCRCAIAHAGINRSTFDPEDPNDERRLRGDLPLIKALAVEVIRSQFGVPTKSEVWNRAPYRLEGFRWYIGETAHETLKAGGSLGRRSVPIPHAIDVRTRGSRQLHHFSRMIPRVVAAREGRIEFHLDSTNDAIGLDARLDFANNELRFDPLQNLYGLDDGSASAAGAIAELHQFQKEMIGNGSIELWHSDDALCLAIGEEFVPVNAFSNPAGSDKLIQQWRTIEQSRSADSAAHTPR